MNSLNLSRGERRISTSSSLSLAFSNREELPDSPDSSFESSKSYNYNQSNPTALQSNSQDINKSIPVTNYLNSTSLYPQSQLQHRAPSPTPSNFSTTSSTSRNSNRRGSVSDTGSGRTKPKRSTSRNARASVAPYSRESSLGPGLDFNRALTNDDGGLSDLFAGTALKSSPVKGNTKAKVSRRGGAKNGYDSEWSDRSDGSFKTVSDSESDSDDEEDGDFDIELEEDDKPTKKDREETFGKKKGKQRASILASPTKNPLDIRLENESAGVGLESIGLSDAKAKNIETRRIAFEKMAGAFRSATTASARDKARGAFVQAWLAFSYEEYPGGNVCRPAIYGSYCKACETASVTPINSASFGKAMRQAFPKVKTRRLGVRGNSRYHYCGIGPTNATELAILTQLTNEGNEDPDDSSTSNIEKKPKSKTRRKSILEMDPQEIAIKFDFESESDTGSISTQNTDHSSVQAIPIDSPTVPKTPTTARPSNPDDPVSMRELQSRPPTKPKKVRSNKPLPISVPAEMNTDRGDMEKTLGGKVTKEIPIALRPIVELLRGYPDVEEALRNTGEMELDEDVVRTFWRQYAEISYGLLENLRNHQYDKFETTIVGFWKTIDRPTGAIVQHPVISNLIYRADAVIYDHILDYLHSQILVPLPSSAFLALRRISENMEQLQSNGLAVFTGSAFSGPKVELAARFGHLVSRHLGLCQLAQAMTNIVSDRATMRSLAEAWDLIDLEAVKNQSALVSNCAHELLTECFDRFKQLLYQPGPSPTESIILWAEQVYRTAITSTANTSQTTSPRSLLIRFNFVTSQIIRDLVLSSAPTFGSWQIISLFLDEFLAFQILRKVALEISGIALEPPPHTRGRENGLLPEEIDFSYYSMEGNSNEMENEISSIAPNSSNFPTSFEQFSPNTRGFLERSSSDNGENYQTFTTSSINLENQNYLFSQTDLGNGGISSFHDMMGLGIGGMSPYQGEEMENQFAAGGGAGGNERFSFDRYEGFETQQLF